MGAGVPGTIATRAVRSVAIRVVVTHLEPLLLSLHGRHLGLDLGALRRLRRVVHIGGRGLEGGFDGVVSRVDGCEAREGVRYLGQNGTLIFST